MSHRRRFVERSHADAGVGPAAAEDVVGTDVAILHALLEAGIAEAPLLLEVQQLAGFVFGEVIDLPQIAGEHQHPAIRVENLGPPIGPLDVLAVADGAVVGQDHDVRFCHERQDRVGKCLAAGRFVLGDRHFAQKDLDLGQHALRNRFVGDGKGRGVGRMAMDAALDLGPRLHDRQVQQHFAGPLFAAGKLVAIHVDGANIVGLEKAFADHRGRAENFLLADAIGDVAVVGGRKTFGVNPPADFADFLFDLMDVDHAQGSLELV